ncbi:DNA-directed RNA polymerase subunit beta [Salmon gill poxvirus]|uniref:DNA-directed RNA polymerase n=1 Tax=Salmon gill poxvirus TaxID=1680908 RepID=A0A6M5KB23_9POXV|nr:DNA-directed RNA polymerase subunit beta [Salmon gill poxvirus]WMX26532.1 DNA-directed RNA polymerase subunit beta [Salmon gill poxvirus]
MDKKIGYLFLKPDPKCGVFYRPLDFQYKSYRNFLEFRINEILEIDRELHSDKTGDVKMFLKIYNIEKTFPTNTMTLHALKNKGYTCSVKFNIMLYSKTRTDSGIKEAIILNYTGFNDNMINVPLMVGYGLGDVFGSGAILYPNEIGGTFLNYRSIEKIGINLLEKTTAWPKFKKVKAGQYAFSFSSISPPHITPPVYRYFKIVLDFNNPEAFVISSQKMFITVNILILIKYLLKCNMEFIRDELLNGLDPVNDYFLHNVVNMFVTGAENKIQNIVTTSSVVRSVVKEFINFLVEKEYNDSRSKLTLKEFKNNMFTNFLPHIHNNDDVSKGLYLLLVVKMFLFAIIKPHEYPDRDSHATRRIFTYGSYFEQVTIDELENFVTKIKNAGSTVNHMSMTTMGFNSAFNNLLSGRFRKTISPHIRTHVHYSWMQNVVIPRSIGFYPDQVKIAKIFNCRQFHPSQYGFFCPTDIPDHGESVGLVIQLALHSYITSIKLQEYKQIRNEIIREIKNILGVKSDDPATSAQMMRFKTGVPIMIENKIICSVAPDLAIKIVEVIRNIKRSGMFCVNDFGVTYIQGYIRQIKFNIGAGRVVRPLLVIDNGELVMEKYRDEIDAFDGTWSELLETFPGVIEIIDIEQFIYSNIIENQKVYEGMSLEQRKLYQYCDFPEEFRNGYSASCLLGINHNAGPRAIFGCAQVKQSISCLTSDILNKIDNGLHMIYPEKPLVVSMGIITSLISDNTFGQHINVALTSCEGMNQEDAIVCRQGFLDNHGMNILSTKKTQLDIPNENFRASQPDYTVHNYGKLNHLGVPVINSILEAGDAMCKNVSIRVIDNLAGEVSKEAIKSDISEGYTDIYPGRTVRVQIENSDKVKVRLLTVSERQPIMGDKFTSRTSQKGTIAKILPDHEMPYMEDGTKPDFIINSTSIYSRKTLAMLLEMILTNVFTHKPINEQGKVRYVNFPSFNNVALESYFDFGSTCIKTAHPDWTPEQVNDELFCEQTLYNPDTHEPYKSKFMVGMLYYLRLRHMILDKAAIRSRGKKTKLTKQPNEGRKRGGGIRFGEMERDCLIGHGAAFTLREILHDSEEDRQKAKMCNECGDFLMLSKTESYQYWTCSRCDIAKLHPTYTEADLSHVVKVFKTQLGAQGIKMLLKESETPSVYYTKP